MKEIREAVKALKHYKPTNNEIAILIDLAEKVLAAKMPEKKDVGEYDFETTGNEDDAYHYGMNRGEIYGYNEAIDACQIAITGILEDLQQIVIEDVPHQYQDRLLEKLGGVR